MGQPGVKLRPIGGQLKYFFTNLSNSTIVKSKRFVQTKRNFLKNNVFNVAFYLVSSWLKLASSCPKLAPSWHQVGPSWLQVGPSSPEVGPKLAQVAPRWPKLAQVGPKSAHTKKRRFAYTKHPLLAAQERQKKIKSDPR